MSDLAGRKIVVLGASAGIGRCFGIRAVRAGADVLLCGRRAEKLEEVVVDAGGGTPCPVDVSLDSDIERLAGAVAAFGPVDAVVCTVGTAPLKRMETMSRADWTAVLQTNVVGINCAINAMLPSITDGAPVLVTSSEVVTMPRWALAAYSASKAALEVSVAGWRLEYPRLRFGVVGVGATVPTEFGRDFEDGILGTALELWARHGLAQEDFMVSDDVAQVLAGILAAVLPFPGINVERLVLRTPSPVIGSADLMRSVLDDTRVTPP